MAKFNARSYTQGSAALKIDRTRKQAAIIELPRTRRQRQAQERTRKPAANRLQAIAYRSEMYCSLITETCAGCAYNLFTNRQIRLFSIALVIVMAIALVMGA